MTPPAALQDHPGRPALPDLKAVADVVFGELADGRVARVSRCG
jgi:hypothetical protein